MHYHIAQFNIAPARAPIDSDIMSEFVNRLDEINGLGEQAPGFVWRYKTDSGNSISVRIYEDERIIINMSVWESIEALHEFTYYSAHAEVFRRHREWFEALGAPSLVLWWVPAGHHPDLTEAKQKLEYVQQHGPTPLAFTFRQRYTVEEMLAHTEVEPK